MSLHSISTRLRSVDCEGHDIRCRCTYWTIQWPLCPLRKHLHFLYCFFSLSIIGITQSLNKEKCRHNFKEVTYCSRQCRDSDFEERNKLSVVCMALVFFFLLFFSCFGVKKRNIISRLKKQLQTHKASVARTKITCGGDEETFLCRTYPVISLDCGKTLFFPTNSFLGQSWKDHEKNLSS